MKEDKEDDHGPRDIITNEFDTARRKEQIFKETLAFLEKDEKAQEYFKKFNKDTVPSAIKSYAWIKADWLVNKDGNERALEYFGLSTKVKAEHCLGNIQQKKLFNKQCEWRAGQFTHPSIETTKDFLYWEYNILNCPFLDPITQDDIELYTEYLASHTGGDIPFIGHWQDYNSYNSGHVTIAKMMNKPEDEETDEDIDEDDEEFEEDMDEDFEFDDEDDEEEEMLMPPWYVLCDERRGEGHYLLLADVKQEKEWHYASIGLKDYHANLKPEEITNPPGALPMLSLSIFDKTRLIDFINTVEKNPKEILKAYELYERLNWSEEEKSMERVRDAWEELSDCYEPFPIAEGIRDWKKALIATAEKWGNHKVARMLPVVYDEYLFRLNTGIEQPYDRKQAKSYREMADHHKKMILRGRELSGEPRDLNF